MNLFPDRDSTLARAFRAATFIPPPAPQRPVDVSLALFVAIPAYILLFLVAGRLLGDPDTLWHIAVGREIWTTGAAPDVDSFSSTMRGEPFHSMHWLAQVILYACYRLGGFTALAALTAFSAAATLGIIFRYLLEKLDFPAAITFCLVTLLLLAPHLTCRPHALVAPLMALWTIGLLRAAESGAAPWFGLLPLMTLWANMHGSFVFGLGLVIPLSLESWLRPTQVDLARYLVFGLAALGAAMASPYGIEQLTMVLRHFDLGDTRLFIDEMRPQDFSRFGAFEAILLAGFAAALSSGVVVPATRLVVLIALLHMALAHVRHADLLGVVGVLLLADPVARRFPQRFDADYPRWRNAVLVGLASIAGLQTFWAFATGAVMPPESITPEAALAAAVTERAEGRVFNDFDFGGYLMFKGVPTFIDGRLEFYGPRFFAEYKQVLDSSDSKSVTGYLDRNAVGWTLLKPGRAVVGVLDHDRGWRRVYADQNAVVHLRLLQSESK
jgi:hypothetical protein